MKHNILGKMAELTSLSPSEKKIAQYIEVYYPNSVLDNINIISEKSGVSIATVSRFIQKLGYENFNDFRKQAQEEITDRLASPVTRYTPVAGKKSFKGHLQTCADNLQETVRRMDEADFERAIEIMLNADALYITGGASASALAKYFYLFCRYLKKNVHLLEPDISTMAHNLADMGENDALFVISHYRSSSVATKLAEFFHKKECPIILVTDRQISPITLLADVSLVVCSESESIFNSRTVTLALLESIIDCMVTRCEADMKDRFKLMEEVFETFRVYSK